MFYCWLFDLIDITEREAPKNRTGVLDPINKETHELLMDLYMSQKSMAEMYCRFFDIP